MTNEWMITNSWTPWEAALASKSSQDTILLLHGGPEENPTNTWAKISVRDHTEKFGDMQEYLCFISLDNQTLEAVFIRYL
jgi:hypothetical protein